MIEATVSRPFLFLLPAAEYLWCSGCVAPFRVQNSLAQKGIPYLNEIDGLKSTLHKLVVMQELNPLQEAWWVPRSLLLQ